MRKGLTIPECKVILEAMDIMAKALEVDLHIIKNCDMPSDKKIQDFHTIWRKARHVSNIKRILKERIENHERKGT